MPRTVKRAGGDLKLLNATKRISDLLTITKLITVFEIFEDEAAAVLIRLHQVIEAGVGEELFQPQRLVELFGDVDQGELVVGVEIVGLAPHVPAQPAMRATNA